jgi:hypothetical protein
MLVLKLTLLAMVLLLARRLAFAQPKEVFVPMRDGAQLAGRLRHYRMAGAPALVFG